jgi:PTS system beta-glucosides-specific IIC component
LDQIKAAGYDVVTPVLVCNSDDYAAVDAVTGMNVNPGDTIVKITK